MALKHIIPSNIFELIDRAGISTPKQLIMLSVLDIKKSTNLGFNDILLLKNIVSDYMCPNSVTGYVLKETNNLEYKVTSGCNGIDNLLKGGFRKGTITEVFGESGCGKTQLALQIALHNWADKCVYICTEDLFPTKRFEELKKYLPNYDPKINYGRNVFVEHITEAKDLLSCIRVRLPKLLAQNHLSFMVIDSVAAPFRCETTNYVKRAEDLREIAILLTEMAQKYNLAILCINQVTASFEDSDNVLPALGLAWSNMVTTRLMMKKTNEIADTKCIADTSCQLFICKQDVCIRELHVAYAPDLPYSVIKFIIVSSGIQTILD